MLLKKLELHGFKSFAQKSEFLFDAPVTAIVGPNGSGKSNVVESIRFVLGEQSSKSLRSKSGADIPFAGSKKLAKMNRAKVAITFDNHNRIFKLTNAKNEKVSVDFDTITISREVFSDGSNTYAINGNEVRLRDIHELIANVNIGSSGHHIISQGEADRLLNANAKDRKEMIEEALGLKIFQFRIKETEKKLEKSQQNVHESKSLRREIAPHLTYLEKQVQKIHEAEQLRSSLRDNFQEYLGKQEAYLQARKDTFSTQEKELQDQLTDSTQELAEIKKILDQPIAVDAKTKLDEQQAHMRTLQLQRDELSRKVGKLEGMLEMAQQPTTSPADITIKRQALKSFSQNILDEIKDVLGSDSLEKIHVSVRAIQQVVQSFVAQYDDSSNTPPVNHSTQELQDALQKTQDDLAELDAQISQSRDTIQQLQHGIDDASHHVRAQERVYFEKTNKQQQIQSQLNVLQVEKDTCAKDTQRFEQDLDEARQLFGADFSYECSDDDSGPQDTLRRSIERTMIKLEDMGGGSGADTITEFNEIRERDQFLEKEIRDLEESITQLEEIITDLQQELSQQFATGIKKINTQFNEFFSVLFGGGKAALSFVEVIKRRRSEDEADPEKEVGIDITVSLPRKKVQDLDMLSGGERSLTSIALLFALSQVNPPPFLVLDETDAALDEANSARYGDMLEQLSKYSQLIVVTHNRETMSRADILYGVTMGSQECSQLLSVKFDDAAQFAK